MNKPLIKILACLTAIGMAASAYSLTIIPTLDASITGSTNAVAISNAVNAAIQVFQNRYADNQTIRIKFVSDEAVGLGQSSTQIGAFSYSDYLNGLRAHATSKMDSNALSKIPLSATDPILGGNQIVLSRPLAALMGLTSASAPGEFDSTISCKMSLMNFTRPPADPNKYDLQQVLEHEIDEVFGTPSNMPDPTMISPIDLFRYTTNLARTYTTNGDNAYFSVDGTNLIARFNMDPGGDYSDWWSVYYPSNWSPVLGVTTVNPQVQDAFSGPGNALDLGVSELTMVDVIGWTLSSVVAPVPSLKIVSAGSNYFTLSWTNTATGYALQESTNLSSSSNWIASATGTTNPAVVSSAGKQKFYRLYKSAAAPQSLAIAAAPAGNSQTSFKLKLHVTHPLQP